MPQVLRRRRALYLATTIALSTLVGLALLESVIGVPVYGVTSERVRSRGGGYELTVHYGVVTRPALATPFDITVTSPGGFDGPVTVAVDQGYLAMWDENGLVPAPESEAFEDGRLVWEFAPPEESDTLFVSFDARIEPAVQSGRAGEVAVLDESGDDATSVSFYTRVMP